MSSELAKAYARQLGGGGAATSNLAADYYKMSQQAYAANLARRTEVEDIYDRIISMYGAGGTYGEAALELLGRAKVQDVGRAEQQDISRGLYGVRSRAAEWEAGPGATGRLKLEDIKTERLSSALQAKAGFLAGIQEPYPDYGALMQASGAGGGYGGMPISTTPPATTTGYGGAAPSAPAEAGESVEAWRARLQEQQRGLDEIEISRPGGAYGPMFEASEGDKRSVVIDKPLGKGQWARTTMAQNSGESLIAFAKRVEKARNRGYGKSFINSEADAANYLSSRLTNK